MPAASNDDRQLAADVVHLVGNLDAFAGVYVLENQVEYRLAVLIEDDLSRIRALARLTVLSGAHLLVVSSVATIRHRGRLDPSSQELADAAKRDEARRAAWSTCRLDVDARVAPARRAKSVLIVSATAARHADALRTSAGTQLTTYGIAGVGHALDMLGVYPLPDVIVIDRDLPGAFELENRVRDLYPSRFGAFDRVQYLSSKRGLQPEDIERILKALGTTFKPSVVTGPFAKLSVLVVDAPGGTLGAEVLRAAPGAVIEIAGGWESIERLAEGGLDMLICGDPGEIGLASLVRFAHRCDVTPILVLAMDAPKSDRMGAAYPKLAHYFIPRPVCSDDLLRALVR